MMNHVMNFINDEEGATAIEYGLLAALIAAVIIASVQALGSTLDTTFSNINAQVSGT